MSIIHQKGGPPVIKRLQSIGFSSNLAYLASLASIIGSIVIWFSNKGDDPPHAERFGIFVGLWAPTFAILGRALEETERHS